jgi:hypothetical protein
MLTGCAGGFFFPAAAGAEKIKPGRRKKSRTGIGIRRRNIATEYYSH